MWYYKKKRKKKEIVNMVSKRHVWNLLLDLVPCINVVHVLWKSTKTFALFVQINEFFLRAIANQINIYTWCYDWQSMAADEKWEFSLHYKQGDIFTIYRVFCNMLKNVFLQKCRNLSIMPSLYQAYWYFLMNQSFY